MANLFDKAGIELGTGGPDWSAEASMVMDGKTPVCGVDEVGRGPLAGPVVAAAVILDPDDLPTGLNDSKKLSASAVWRFMAIFRKRPAPSPSLRRVSREIDEMNILRATMLAMRRAVAGLDAAPKAALVDGNRDPGLDIPTRTLIKGDSRSLSIAAASIVAKVFRDDLMKKLHEEFPDYGWAQNAGYGVANHLAALKIVGATRHHRRSFAPIRHILNEE